MNSEPNIEEVCERLIREELLSVLSPKGSFSNKLEMRKPLLLTTESNREKRVYSSKKTIYFPNIGLLVPIIFKTSSTDLKKFFLNNGYQKIREIEVRSFNPDESSRKKPDVRIHIIGTEYNYEIKGVVFPFQYGIGRILTYESEIQSELKRKLEN